MNLCLEKYRSLSVGAVVAMIATLPSNAQDSRQPAAAEQPRLITCGPSQELGGYVFVNLDAKTVTVKRDLEAKYENSLFDLITGFVSQPWAPQLVVVTGTFGHKSMAIPAVIPLSAITFYPPFSHQLKLTWIAPIKNETLDCTTNFEK